MRSILFLLLLISSLASAQEAQVRTLVNIQATAGMSVAADGTLYVADFGDINTLAGTSLFKVSPQGQISLITNQLNTAPSGNLLEPDGSLLQSIYLSNRIVRVQPDGTITNFANNIPGPDDMVRDSNGNLFVASCPLRGPPSAIYRIDAAGNSEIFSADPRFRCIVGITIDDNDNLYVPTPNGTVLRVTPDANVSVFAQLGANGSHIKFANNEFYVLAPRMNQVLRIDRQGNVSTLAGTGQAGTVDGPASEAQFNFPFHLEISPDGRFLYVNGGPNGDVAANPVRIIDLFPSTGTPIAPRLRSITSAWNDPTRSGEGFIIQTIQDQDRAAVFWGTYDNLGQQRWFTGVGDFSGDQLITDMVVTSGGVFGDEFDPDAIQRIPVGTITMTMTDCDNIVLDYEIEGISGTQNLRRTFRLDNLTCIEGDSNLSRIFNYGH
ncbi:MAG: hypothetical protein Tsb002_20930 [Wenzhouxiangellaceae bacterium]